MNNPTNDIHARIFFIKARKVNKAIVFRRGPTDWIQMIVWDLDNDSLQYGQWINKKVPMRNCDVSPSGKYLIYFVDHFEHTNSRTVISRPPFWTALTAWEHGDSLFGNGGGLFADEKIVILNLHSEIPTDKYPIPPDLTIHPFQSQKEYNLWKGHINLIHEQRLEMNGWTEHNDVDFVQKETAQTAAKKNSDDWIKKDPKSADPINPKLWKKSISNNTSLYMITFYHFEHRKNFDTFYLVRKKEIIKLNGITWADVDNRNRIIATKEGKLYSSKISSDGSVDYINLQVVHDLNSQTPKRILTPLEMKSWD